MPALTNRPTAVYRLKDATGRLLYVGVTTNPDVRFKRHQGTAPWWPLVAERLVDWHATRPAAEEAEAIAIKGETPLYNRSGSAAPQTLADDFPIEAEVSKNQLRLRLADVLHASAVQGRITYITDNGRRVAAIAPLAVAEPHTT